MYLKYRNNMKQEFVNWKIFIWAIAIILGLFSISFGMIASAQLKQMEHIRVYIRLNGY